MKKSLLFAISMAFAISASAQVQTRHDAGQRVKASTQSNRKAPAYKLMKATDKAQARANAPKKAEGDANIVLYSKPEGALYLATDKEGRGYYATRLIVTPWENFTYKNISTKPDETIWKTYNYQVEAYTTATPEEDNTYSGSLDPGYYSHTPMLLNFEATDTFQIGYTNNSYARDPAYADYSTDPTVHVDSITTLAFTDWHNGGYGWGSIDTGYLYGTGGVQWTDPETGTAYAGKVWALRQDYPAPMTPLYIEDIYLDIKSQTKNPLPDGKQLILYVIDTESGEDIAVIPVTNADITKEEGQYAEGTSTYAALTGEYANYQIVFTQKEQDDYGTEYTVPIVVEKAFTLMLTGLDQEGVDFGTNSVEYCYDASGVETADTELRSGRFVFEDEATGESIALGYGDHIPFNFTGMLDAINVAENLATYDQTTGEVDQQFTDCNVLYVTNDGTQSLVLLDEQGSYIPGVMVYTAQPWVNEDNDEFYFIDEYPDWITEIVVDGSNYGHTAVEMYEGEPYYYYVLDDGFSYVSVKAEPLPEGVTGRSAELYIQGRGVKSDTPIIVIQGDVEQDGITEVGRSDETIKNAKVYNLNGQQVNGRTHGLLIKNGKKVMVK